MKSIDAPFEICWDELGIPHIFASTVADAFRGMGYAAASERLWQIHLSTLYATGTAASVLGPRFTRQDLLHQAFNVPAHDLPESPGDWIADAYLDGLNGYVSELDELPPEFRHAGTEPRTYTRHDIASRYRFTGWFQHKSWMNKIYLGKLMARHGTDQFRSLVHRFSDGDADEVEELRDALLMLDARAANLVLPDARIASGSNNWAIRSNLSASGAPMLAMDPHQAHTIPNTFFYAHLSAPGLNAFGASFPGVPYFMMGFNEHLAWGLTTGMIDTYDIYVEKQDTPLTTRHYDITVAGEEDGHFDIDESKHGPILESLTDALEITSPVDRQFTTALYWSMRDTPTSAGVLASLPLATTSEQLGGFLFENDVSPLVNNIICVDRDNDLRRFIAATLPKRQGVTGSVPLAGWRSDHEFEMTTASDLFVEHNPASGFALTANNDTLGEDVFPIHTFPAHPARSARIRELLSDHVGGFSIADFEQMQLDLHDVKARETVPHIIDCLTRDSREIQRAVELLKNWDCRADVASQAASIYYLLLDRFWQIRFMYQILDDRLLLSLAEVAGSVSMFDLGDFLAEDSPWSEHRGALESIICDAVQQIVEALDSEFGEICAFGKLQSIAFQHSLAKHPAWAHMKLEADALGGSGTTLAMAVHMPVGENSSRVNVVHGPVFRWIVDLADPKHVRFVLSGGNGGNADSPFIGDHFEHWVNGKYFDLSLVRDELKVVRTSAIR